VFFVQNLKQNILDRAELSWKSKRASLYLDSLPVAGSCWVVGV